MGIPVILQDNSEEPSTLSAYSVANGMEFRDNIAAEQLLKSAEDLTDDSYWTNTNTTDVAQPDGSTLVTATANGTFPSIQQNTINWIPVWAKNFGAQVSFRAGTSTEATISVFANGGIGLTGTSAEIVSGPGAVSMVNNRAEITGLSTTEYTTVFMKCLEGVDLPSTNDLVLYLYPNLVSDGNANVAGDSVYINLPQLVIGDQVKTRPTQTDVNDWMMAYRPHNRVTKDGAARYYVVDTEGLVSVGECTDIQIALPALDYFDSPDGSSRTTISYTEANAGHRTYIKYGNVDGTIRYIGIRIEADGTLKGYASTGSSTESTSVATLSLGETYRITMEIESSGLWRMFVDDALVGTGTFTATAMEAMNAGLPGRVLNTANNYIISESYPRKASGIINAGGKNAYGTEDVILAQPNLSSFPVGSGNAMMVTMKRFTDATAATLRFGLDTDTNGSVTTAGSWLLGGVTLEAAGGALNDVYADFTANMTRSLLVMARSDTNGYQFFDHDSGKQWKRVAATETVAPAANLYPSIGSYNGAYYLTNFALLDLSKIHEAEFCEVTDTETNPANNTAFNCAADYHLNTTFTYEDGKYIYWFGRFVSVADYGIRLAATTGGGVQVYQRDADGATLEINAGAGTLSDGVAYEIDLVVNGSNASLYLDKVLLGSTTSLDINLSTSAGYSQNTIDTNDIVLTTHPYPALGGSKLGATDRLVCPQDDDTFDAPSNVLAIARNISTPSGESKILLRGQTTDPALQIVVGENSLTVPYLKTFDSDTIGQEPAGITYYTDGGYYTANLARVIASPTDSYSYNPNINIVKLNSSVTEAVWAEFPLPVPYDFTTGFRCCWWYVGEANNQTSLNVGVWDGTRTGGDSRTGFYCEPNTVNGQEDLLSYGYYNGTYISKDDPNTGNNANNQRYYQLRAEWNQTNKTLTTALYESETGFVRAGWTARGVNWGSSITSWSQIDTLSASAYYHANVYLRDIHLCGYWLGSLTDAFPGYDKPQL